MYAVKSYLYTEHTVRCVLLKLCSIKTRAFVSIIIIILCMYTYTHTGKRINILRTA